MFDVKNCKLQGKDKSIYYCGRSSCNNFEECYALFSKRKNEHNAQNDAVVKQNKSMRTLKIKEGSPLLKS